VSAFRYQIVQEILRILQKEVDFTPDPIDAETADPIPPENMTIRKTVAQRPINKGYVAEQFPMVRVTFPFKEDVPIDAGTNERDEYRYRFLIQIIDSDNYEPEMNLATYFLWQERICRKFNYKELTDDGNLRACVALCTAFSVDTVDETQWVKEENFKAGVGLVVRTWMTRNP